MLGALAALLPAGAAAQQPDARQRTTETIVADGLAQLPAADAKVFNQVMGELAATGSKGVEMIAAMLVPADKGKNATFEYALNGVVAYVTDPAHEALRDDVRKGLLAAIDRCGDDANRAFLFSQLQFCSTAADAAAMARYLDDPYLAGYALRALVSPRVRKHCCSPRPARTTLPPPANRRSPTLSLKSGLPLPNRFS